MKIRHIAAVAVTAAFIIGCTPAVAERPAPKKAAQQIQIEDTAFEQARLKEEQAQYKREEAIRQAYENMSDEERMRGIVLEPTN